MFFLVYALNQDFAGYVKSNIVKKVKNSEENIL